MFKNVIECLRGTLKHLAIIIWLSNFIVTANTQRSKQQRWFLKLRENKSVQSMNPYNFKKSHAHTHTHIIKANLPLHIYFLHVLSPFAAGACVCRHNRKKLQLPAHWYIIFIHTYIPCFHLTYAFHCTAGALTFAFRCLCVQPYCMPVYNIY